MKRLTFAFFVCGLATHLCAGSIAILNPSFEADALTLACPGCSTDGTITDWSGPSTDPDSHVEWGAWMPSAVSYPGGGSNTTPATGIPDGVNVAYALEDGPDASIYQFLTATLQANDTYTFTGYAGLRVDTGVFNPGLGCYGAGAVVEAGGNVLTPVVSGGDIPCPPHSTLGSFTEFTFTFSTGSDPAGLGDPLEIVLTASGSGNYSEPAEIDFDDLSLSDTLGSGSGSGVPEPATFGTMAAALAICVLLFRRRATA